MPKQEFLSPKAIANRMKARGLQKLRWFCQMCEKQCRDENGFKCHTNAESHQRQLLLLAENPEKFIEQFSRDFLNKFKFVLKNSFGTRRVLANRVYYSYISEPSHIHMNATRWETLTDFVKFLGREGHCIVDHTEKGWFISYRDPQTNQEELKNRKKLKRDDEEKMAKILQSQKKKYMEPEVVSRELIKNGKKISFSIQRKKPLINARQPSMPSKSSAGTSRAEEKQDQTSLQG